MSADARIAVLVAAYNAEATLERAVLSALAQPETAEVCIVDDGSGDGTSAVARDLAARDPRVIVQGFAANGGPSAARNAGIAATRSPWLAVLDADDHMLEGRLGALLSAAGEADFIADALIRVAPGETPEWRRERLQPRTLDFTGFVLGNQGVGALDLGFMKPLMRRSFLDTHGLRYRAEMRLGEDYELYARALAHGARFLVCGPAGYVSVERPGSLSKEHSETDLLHLRDCDDGLARIRPLAPDERRALRRHWRSVDRRLQWRRLISAVKRRDVGAAAATFHSPDAALYLAGKLAEQAWLRGTGRGPPRDRLSTSGAH